MKHLSRRDFIHAGCAAGVATLVPSAFDRAEASRLFHGGVVAAPTGHKAQINLNSLNGNSFGQEYPFIDVARTTIGPWTSKFATNDYNTLLSTTGYPTAMPTGTFATQWNTTCLAYLTGSDPWVLKWDGSADVEASFQNCSVSQVATANRIEYTITTTIGAPLYDPVFAFLVINSITTAPTKISLFRKSQETNFNNGEVSNPDFRTAYGIYGRIRMMDAMQTNQSAASKWSQLPTSSNMSWIGQDLNIKDYVGRCARSGNDFTAPGSPSGSPSSWADGQMIVAEMPRSYLASGTNGVNPTLTTTAAHGLSNGDSVQFSWVEGGSWGNLWTTTVWQVSSVTSNTFVIVGIDSTTWGTVLFGRVDSCPNYFAISNITPGTTTTIVTSAAHGFSNGDQVWFINGEISGSIATLLNGGTISPPVGTIYSVTVTNSTTFTIPVNSTGFTYSSGGYVAKQIRFSCSGLPAKRVLTGGSAFQNPYLGDITQMNATPCNLIYDADYDCLLYQPATGETGAGVPFSAPISVLVQLCNETGVSPWLCIPHRFDDASALTLATYTKANSIKPTCLELSNEVWGSTIGRGGFGQCVYAWIKGVKQWPSLVGEEAMNNWYGWRFYNMMAQVDSAYSGSMSQVVREFAVWTAANNNATITQRMQAASAGLPAFPTTRADELAIAPYYEWDRGCGPSAFAVYSIKIGNTAAGIADMDAMMSAPYAQYSANITGTTMTVTAVSSGTLAVGQSVYYSGVTNNPNNGYSSAYIKALGTGTGGTGTYTLNLSQTTVTGAGCSSTPWFNYGTCTQVLYPFWSSAATTAGLKMSCYEGGFGVTPSADNQPTSYDPGTGPVTLTLTDCVNAMIAYKTSTAFEAMLANVLTSYKSQGGVYVSQFDLRSAPPNANNAFSIIVGNLYNFTPDAAYTSFLNYNNA